MARQTIRHKNAPLLPEKNLNTRQEHKNIAEHSRPFTCLRQNIIPCQIWRQFHPAIGFCLRDMWPLDQQLHNSRRTSPPYSLQENHHMDYWNHLGLFRLWYLKQLSSRIYLTRNAAMRRNQVFNAATKYWYERNKKWKISVKKKWCHYFGCISCMHQVWCQ